MTGIDMLYSGAGPAQSAPFDLFDDSDLLDQDFASSSCPAQRIYNGPYPMVDHIMMPIYEPTPDVHISQSDDSGCDDSAGKIQLNRPRTGQRCEQA